MRINYPYKFKNTKVILYRVLYYNFINISVKDIEVLELHNIRLKLEPNSEDGFYNNGTKEIFKSLSDSNLFYCKKDDEILCYEPQGFSDDSIIISAYDIMHMIRYDENLRFLRHYIRHTPDVLKFLLEDAKINFCIATYNEGEETNTIFERVSSPREYAEKKIARPVLFDINFSPHVMKYFELLRCVDRKVTEEDEILAWKYRAINDPYWF